MTEETKIESSPFKTIDRINENQDPELAMREACKRHGEFKRNRQGALEFDDYIELRRIIIR
jgi:hypothetical protein